MAWTGYQVLLAGLMLVTGSINTIATKWADMAVVSGRPDGIWKNGTSTKVPHPFSHSFLQAFGMFIGEFSCLIAFILLFWRYARYNRAGEEEDQESLPSILQGNREFNPVIFLAPSACDMVGTTIMYIGLNLTYASSAQMFRGAVIIFTGIFSIVFLKRRLYLYHWIGILLVLLGLTVVGCADVYFGDHNSAGARNVFLGDCLIIAAQIITAAQMVLEEKFVVAKNIPPLQAVGWEGLFGVLIMGFLLIPLNYINYQGVPIEDSIDGIYQMLNSSQVAIGYMLTVVSISFFNFAGVSFTKELSATSRMVFDSVRILVIWAFTLLVRWNSFIPLTLLGFVLLIVGMVIYNRVIVLPCLPDNSSDSDSDVTDERRLFDED